MNLVIFNGSPRLQKSNSKILATHFVEGYRTIKKEEDIPVFFLMGKNKLPENLEVFKKAQRVIIIFPLYTDSMPAIVKEFLEEIYLLKDGKPRDLGFIVQSGFPETIHSVYVERYLEKFTRRIGCNYLGTVIKGGVEGIQVMPPSMTRSLFTHFNNLGQHFAITGEFSPVIIKKLRGPLRMSSIKFLGFRLLSRTGILNMYWNNQLKKNNAWEKRFDKPLL